MRANQRLLPRKKRAFPEREEHKQRSQAAHKLKFCVRLSLSAISAGCDWLIGTARPYTDGVRVCLRQRERARREEKTSLTAT